jgi:hypothetical protein
MARGFSSLPCSLSLRAAYKVTSSRASDPQNTYLRRSSITFVCSLVITHQPWTGMEGDYIPHEFRETGVTEVILQDVFHKHQLLSTHLNIKLNCLWYWVTTQKQVRSWL